MQNLIVAHPVASTLRGLDCFKVVIWSYRELGMTGAAEGLVPSPHLTAFVNGIIRWQVQTNAFSGF